MSGWIAKFADNGWMDWFCPCCGKNVYNEDVHVRLDWKYCPYCGREVSKERDPETPMDISKMYFLRYIIRLSDKHRKMKKAGDFEEAERLYLKIKPLNDFYDDWRRDFDIRDSWEKKDGCDTDE